MPNRVPLDATTARWLPWVVAIAFFMQSLDGTILNTALPAMARDLAENPLRMQGVVIAYMLTVALLIPASGMDHPAGLGQVAFGAVFQHQCRAAVRLVGGIRRAWCESAAEARMAWCRQPSWNQISCWWVRSVATAV